MFLSIFSIAIGLFFAVCGVRILFFGHYQLISDYTPKKGESYGKTVGLLQLVLGLLFVGSGVFGLCLNNETYSYVSLFVLFACYIAAMNLAGNKK